MNANTPDINKEIRFDGQVAIVTGAGQGLGREYALALASRGAKVVVNGRGTRDGHNEKSVVDEICSAGGCAMVQTASVTDETAIKRMVSDVVDRWGRIDILVNNAGFVRDSSFAKLDFDDFQAVMDVHVNGAVLCTKSVWPSMMEQGFGRVIFIISSSGLAGNFGQASYSSAKMALVGLMNTIGLEGERKGIQVNCFSPVGITRMNEAILPSKMQEAYESSKVAPGVVYLASDQAPNRVILMGGAGSFERAYVTFTPGKYIGDSAEDLAAQFAQISERECDILPFDANDQAHLELGNWNRRES